MKKNRRQNRIIEIINSFDVKTQEELIELLYGEGYVVTQATVSRDIKELGFVKTATDRGTYKYTSGTIPPKISSRQMALFKESVIKIDSSENIIVIKTVSGGANSAASLIDGLVDGNIVGTIAGDDTIFVAARHKDSVKGLIDKFNKYLS